MTTSGPKYDVAIAGGGPAGSSLAIRLANAGLRVLLAEQKSFPREKLCGEFISPECLVHFAEIGVMPAIAAVRGTDLRETIFFSQRGKGVAVESSWFGHADSLALGLSRAEMDRILLEHARAAGVDVREESSVSGLLLDGGEVSGVAVRDTNGIAVEAAARVTIDATGRTRSLARRIKGRETRKRAATHVAFKTHLTGASVLPSACEIYVYRGGYGGCNRVQDGLYNLCFIAASADAKRLGSDPERLMREVVFTNKRAAAAMADASAVKPWLAVPIERFGRGELVPARGLMAVGDAAAFIDPFTGSGMLMALESAKIAADAIVGSIVKELAFDGIAAEYRRLYAARFNRRLRVCSVLRHAAFVPFLAGSLITALSLSSKMTEGLARATRAGA
ncbi:MAG: NAD(P)/FAD-dependent oxidoreductase [Pyrinomonadaceae bacterium]|nr:NAD(P)/FAD-dependent oxidoreductase [Pyrinomonadaceae bacterium]